METISPKQSVICRSGERATPGTTKVVASVGVPRHVTGSQSQNGKQSGNPKKLAQALMTIIGEENPPLRFIAGADAVTTAGQVAATLKTQTDAYRELSSSLGFD